MACSATLPLPRLISRKVCSLPMLSEVNETEPCAAFHSIMPTLLLGLVLTA